MDCSFTECKGNKDFLPNLNGEVFFKSCHYCCTFYCSKECRQLDWDHHKREKCFYGKMSSLCKRILSKSGKSPTLRTQLCQVSAAGYAMTRQKGVVWMELASIEDAQYFLENPILNSNIEQLFSSISLAPKYVSLATQPVNKILSSVEDFSEIALLLEYFNYFGIKSVKEESLDFYKTLNEYDPNTEMILLVSVRPTNSQTNSKPSNIKNADFMVKFMKMKLLDLNYTIASEHLKNFVIYDFGRIYYSEQCHDREIFFANLLNELRSRNIEMRTQYPKVYEELCCFVEENKMFNSTCFLSQNADTFLICLILPHFGGISNLYDFNLR